MQRVWMRAVGVAAILGVAALGAVHMADDSVATAGGGGGHDPCMVYAQDKTNGGGDHTTVSEPDCPPPSCDDSLGYVDPADGQTKTWKPKGCDTTTTEHHDTRPPTTPCSSAWVDEHGNAHSYDNCGTMPHDTTSTSTIAKTTTTGGGGGGTTSTSTTIKGGGSTSTTTGGSVNPNQNPTVGVKCINFQWVVTTFNDGLFGRLNDNHGNSWEQEASGVKILPGTADGIVVAARFSDDSDGPTIITRGAQSTDNCTEQTTTTAKPGVTTTSSPTPPITGPADVEIFLRDAASVCQNEVPKIAITFGNEAQFAGRTGTLTMSDINGRVLSVQPLVYQPNTTTYVLYPGTSVNPDGSIADVPGWILQPNGFWVQDPSDAILRQGINLLYEVNPSATAFVTYPPESSGCANPTGPFPPAMPPVPPGGLPITK